MRISFYFSLSLFLIVSEAFVTLLNRPNHNLDPGTVLRDAVFAQEQYTENVIGRTLAKKYTCTPLQTSSGRSFVCRAARVDDTGVQLIVKVTKEFARFKREKENYLRCKNDCFAEVLEYVEISEEDRGTKGRYVIIMESGIVDLKELLSVYKDESCDSRGLRGHALRSVGLSICTCISRLHSRGLVWSDLKLDNFIWFNESLHGQNNEDVTKYIFCPDDILRGRVKAVDMESAVPVGSSLVDFSPETLAPEQLTAFSQEATVTTASADILSRLKPLFFSGRVEEVTVSTNTMLASY